MFLLRSCPSCGSHTLAHTPPPRPETEEEAQATRQIAYFRELAELGMQLARTVAARALAEPEPEPEPNPAETPRPAPRREPNPTLLFLRLSYAVRAALAAEARALTRRAELRAQPQPQPQPQSAPSSKPAPARTEEPHLESLFAAVSAELGLNKPQPPRQFRPP